MACLSPEVAFSGGGIDEQAEVGIAVADSGQGGGGSGVDVHIGDEVGAALIVEGAGEGVIFTDVDEGSAAEEHELAGEIQKALVEDVVDDAAADVPVGEAVGGEADIAVAVGYRTWTVVLVMTRNFWRLSSVPSRSRR